MHQAKKFAAEQEAKTRKGGQRGRIKKLFSAGVLEFSSALDNPIGEQPLKTLGAIGFGEQFVQGVEPLRFAGFHRAEHRFQHLGDGLKIEAGIADIGWSTLREQLYQQEIHFIAIEISALLFAQMMREKLLQHLFIYRPGS